MYSLLEPNSNSKYGKMVFCTAPPRLWNSIPFDISTITGRRSIARIAFLVTIQSNTIYKEGPLDLKGWSRGFFSCNVLFSKQVNNLYFQCKFLQVNFFQCLSTTFLFLGYILQMVKTFKLTFCLTNFLTKVFSN